MIPWVIGEDEFGERVLINPTFITMLRRDSTAELTDVWLIGGAHVRLKAGVDRIMAAAEETLAKIAARTQLAHSSNLLVGGMRPQ